MNHQTNHSYHSWHLSYEDRVHQPKMHHRVRVSFYIDIINQTMIQKYMTLLLRFLLHIHSL